MLKNNLVYDITWLLANFYIIFVLIFLNLIFIICYISIRQFFKIKSMTVMFYYSGFLKYISLGVYLITYYFLLRSIYIFCKISTNFCVIPSNKFVCDPYYFTNIFFEYFPLFSVYCSIDLFGLVILFLAYTVGFLCLIALGNKFYHENDNIFFYFFLFLLVVSILVTTSNIILWVIMYECLLLPSFLIVYFASSSRRSIQAALYFVIFTQIGSFIVICVISYIVATTNIYTFDELSKYTFSSTEYFFIYFFFFLGFGIKIPIWPFHYWLTKTHVEASAGFSMYLSGFLVKVALLGFYKFAVVLGSNVDNSLFVLICIMGIIDASLKLFCQTDIKKLVAYCTILEMNIIYLTVVWGDTSLLLGGIIFVYTHGFLSAVMFFLVDCVQKRYGSRNVTAVCGVLHTTPNLAIAIFLMFIIFSGIPGSTKFVSELLIFSTLFTFSPLLSIMLLFFVNFFALVGFSKSWFNILFGMSNKYSDANIIDLNYAEIFIIFTCFFFLISFVFFPICI